MKNSNMKSMKIIFSLFTLVVAAFYEPTARFIITNPSINQNPVSLYETEIIILDEPQKKLKWNTSGSISAILQTQNTKFPIINEEINLELFYNDTWNFFLSTYTNLEGIADFTFRVILFDGEYDYSITYCGNDLYQSCSSNSSFIVVENDEIKPSISIDNIVCTDAGISFDYDVYSNIPGTDQAGGILRLKIGAYIETSSGYGYHDWIYLNYPNLRERVTGSYFTDALSPFAPPGILVLPVAYKLGYLLDEGNVDVKIRVTATNRHWWWIPIFPPEPTKTETKYGTLEDDDPHAPEIRNIDPDQSITIKYPDDYKIRFTIYDYSPFDSWIQYRFKNESFTSSSYGPFLFTSTAGVRELLCSIPKTTWFTYPDTEVQFKVRAKDKDYDGDREHDMMDTGWPLQWQAGGKIISKIEGRIESLRTYASIKKGANQREWDLVSISSDSMNLLYRDIYVNDFNLIKMSIGNPTDVPLTITNGVLSFYSDFFSILAPHNIPLIINQDISPGGVLGLESYAKFEDFHFITGWDPAFIDIEFNFTYILSSSESSSTKSSYRIIKPPKPNIEFDQYFGVKEGNEFIYKYGGGSSKIYVRFKLNNSARIPILVNHSLDFTSTIDAELRDKMIIDSTRKTVNVQSDSIYFLDFVLTPDTTFFITRNLALAYILGLPLKVGSLIIKILKEQTKIISKLVSLKEAAWYLRWLGSGSPTRAEKIIGAISVILNLIKIGFLTYTSVVALLTRAEDSLRSYRFHSNCEWSYKHKSPSTITLIQQNQLNYSKYEAELSQINLKPSNHQINQFDLGQGLLLRAIECYIVATPLYATQNIIAAILFDLAGDILVSIADGIWGEANDDLLPNENYSKVFNPLYLAHNFTNYVPKNREEDLASSILNSAVRLQGDLAALNVSRTRKNEALKREDFNSTILQNNAILNYTSMVKDDLIRLSTDLNAFNFHIKENHSNYTQGILYAEDVILKQGLSNEDVDILNSIGFNQTDIEIFNQSAEVLYNNKFMSENLIINYNIFNDSLDEFDDSIKNEIKWFDNYSSSIINETITLKIVHLNETVNSLENATNLILDNLQTEINELFAQGDWWNVIEKAKELISLAKDLSIQYNNFSIIQRYRDFAISIKNSAEENLKLNLYHITSLKITDEDTKSIELIARSGGAPEGVYIIQTNCSWVTPVQPHVKLKQFETNFTQLLISTRNAHILPGSYRVYLRIYLPGTKTEFESILLIDVVDDDQTSPEIDIEYIGDATDGNIGFWKINISDIDSGLQNVQIYWNNSEIISDHNLGGNLSKYYEIPLINVLGTHEIIVVAHNNDNDWIGDQESSTNSKTVIINDDDTLTPQITLKYIGYNNDGDPGFFVWSIVDFDNGLGGDGDSGFDEINITIAYMSSEGLENYIINLPDTDEDRWNLPSNLGSYTINIFARDNDDDRTILIDSLTTEISNVEKIIDDDIDPPILSNLTILPDIFTINISFYAKDEYSGIGNIMIFVNNELVHPISSFTQNNYYYYKLQNEWLFHRGRSQIEIVLEDADYDRVNDSLLSTISDTFENVLFNMYEYIVWEIAELISFMESKFHPCFAKFLIRKLDCSREYLVKAFDLIEAGEIRCGLYYDKLAKDLLRTIEYKIERYNRKEKIFYEISDYIIDKLHQIRNNIVIIMGVSTNTELGMDLGYIAVQTHKLIDFIENIIPYPWRHSLSGRLRLVTIIVEVSLFKIVNQEDISCLLKCVQYILNSTSRKVNQLLRKGKISIEISDHILDELNQIYNHISNLKST